MSAGVSTGPGRRESGLRRAGRASAGALGLAGSLACGASMVLVALGVGASAAATGMAAMSGTGPGAPGGFLGALLRIGPGLLVASVLLVVAAFALSRRPLAAIPALFAGALLYAGMYTQPNLTVMYASIAVGYLTWIGLYLWTRRRDTQRTRAREMTSQ